MKKQRDSGEIIAEINNLLRELVIGRKEKTSVRKVGVINSSKDYNGPAGGIRLLLKEGFFKQPKTASEVLNRLHQDGYRYQSKFIAVYLLRSVRQRLLSRLEVKSKKGNEKWEYAERK